MWNVQIFICHFKYRVIIDEIGFDFYVINKAKWNHIQFNIWLVGSMVKYNAKLIYSTKILGRHNVSDGYWSVGDVILREIYICWTEMDFI
jgi:hypothetical protein